MRIGIDIDDTITNSYEVVINKIVEVCNISIEEIKNKKYTYNDFKKIKNLTPTFESISKNYFDEIIPTVKLKDYASEVLLKLHEMGYTIIIITARNKKEYKDPYKLSYDYLKSHNIYFDELHVGMKDKGLFCLENNIDILIDDSVEHITYSNNLGIKTILFDSDSNKYSTRYKRVNNWLEIPAIIESL